jgi:hypothetical protein
VQGGYGAVFAIRVQILIVYWSDRGTSLIGGTSISWCRSLIDGIGAVSRYRVVSTPQIRQGAEFLLSVDAHVRVQQPLQNYLECRS